ncbi:MAG TPA: branched-chain amino acid ABC transporter substrate-binding protein [Terracidiphilus sp.]
MIAGASWAWWLGFHAVVLLLIGADFALQGRRYKRFSPQTAAWIGTAVAVLAAICFAGWIYLEKGRELALEWVAGYSIEGSLSIDNLFVFLVLFEGFRIGAERQHRALTWGVAGAMVLRAVFILAGVALLQKFEWVTWIFGAFLLYAAWRLLREGSAREAIPGWIRRMQPAKGSLLPVIVAVEFTDLLFAVDSIPAVLAVSHDPFVVYTSNIAAILGLRSLYLAIAQLLDRFRYLHYGLGALLGFVALKMLLSRWIDVPITITLAVIGGVLAVTALVSAAAPRGE